MPLVSCIVNDALVHAMPNVVNVVHQWLRLIDSLLDNTQYIAVDWSEVRDVHWPQTLICDPVVRSKRCPKSSNPALLSSWTVVCLSFTLLMMLLLPGWPIMDLNRIHKKKIGHRFHGWKWVFPAWEDWPDLRQIWTFNFPIPPYPPLGLIWTVMLVWRKGNINRTVSVLSIV